MIKSLLALAALPMAATANASAPPSFTIDDVRVAENGGSATLTIHKSAVAKSYSQVRVYTWADGTATSGVDYQPINVTVTFGNKDLVKTVSVPIIDDNLVEGDETFHADIGAVRFAAIARGQATVTIVDNDVAPAPIPTPAPVPVVSEPVISPNGLAGEFDIADNFDVQTTLIPTVEAVPASLDPNGAFRFTCQPGQLLKDDPIALPGQPGKSHLHQFFGNTGANASSTYQSLRTTGGSTCTRIIANGTVTPLDPTPQRTAYWMPAMLDGIGNAVTPDFFLTYYKALPASSPECGFPDATAHIGICTPLPNDLKFIYGYNMATGVGGPNTTDSSPGSDAWRMAYDCVVPDGTGVSYTGPQHTIADVVATGKCPIGAWLKAAITLPDCWDGVHLDVADHRSHLVAASGAGMFGRRACPADHPYNISEIAIQAFYTVDANFEGGLWHLSSDEMLPGFVVGPSSPVKAGTSLHFDYDEAWSPTVKNMWQTGCINKQLSCNVGELGNGQSIKGMAQDINSFPRHVLVPLASIP